MKVKNIIISSLAIFLFVTCRVNHMDSDVVTVPRYDSSPFGFKITHLWTGIKNPIIVSDNILKIWSDNGVVDTTGFDLANHYIIPKQNGKTRIYTLQKVYDKHGNVDTTMNISLFKALAPPKIKVVINTKLLVDSAILKYDIISESNGKSIFGSHYHYAALGNPKEVFIDNQKIGEIPFYFTLEESRELLSKGNRVIVPPIPLRDMKIDLLIWTDTVDYKYR